MRAGQRTADTRGAEHADQDRPLGRALCHSALAAIATGCRTQGEIAECLGTPLTDASHCLALLQANGLLYSEPDAFRPNLIRLRIAEPLLAFEHAAVWPYRPALEQSDAVEIWRRARPVFDSVVAGPHFAQICRDWVMEFADPAVFGAHPATAAHGSLPDPARRAGPDAEAEVVVRGRADARSGPLLSLGVARWDEVMDLHHLEHLRHLLALLTTRGEDVTLARSTCYSGVGFTPALRAAEADGQVVLVDLDPAVPGATARQQRRCTVPGADPVQPGTPLDDAARAGSSSRSR